MLARDDGTMGLVDGVHGDDIMAAKKLPYPGPHHDDPAWTKDPRGYCQVTRGAGSSSSGARRHLQAGGGTSPHTRG